MSADKPAIRRRLYDRAYRAARVYEQPRDRWLDGVRREIPELVALLGEREIEAIAHVAWGLR